MEEKQPTLEPPVCLRDHTQGSEAAVVTLVAYADYGCAACSQAYASVEYTRQHAGDRMRFVFRHFVTPASRPQGQHAAEAAEAAAAQGRFWEMHNTLIAHEGALDNGHIVEYAAALGLDMPHFLRDVTGHVHAARVREDYDSGIRSGVDTAPAFFINEMRHDGPYDPETLMAALEDVLSPRAS